MKTLPEPQSTSDASGVIKQPELGKMFRETRLNADVTLMEACRILRRGRTTLDNLEDGLRVSERTRLRALSGIEEMLRIAHSLAGK